MSGRVKLGLLFAASATVALVLGTASGAGATSILVVDDDLAQCPNAGYTAIADAIAAASAGDTILVCPGDYTGEGTILVTQRVSLVGYTRALGSLSACSDETGHPATQTTKDSIVAAFQIEANFVSIRGFTVGTIPALPGAESGVLVPGNVSRATVSRNVIQHNSIGVNLNGSNSMVDHNCIRDNNAGGSASGTGIYSDQGLKSSAIDENVFFSNYDVPNDQGAGITLLDAAGDGSLDDVAVTDNIASTEGGFVNIAGSTNSEVSGNTVTGANLDTPATAAGIFLDVGTLGQPNRELLITNNTVTDGDDEGINAADGSLVDSTIKSNTTKGNASYGIHIHDGNTGNTIKKNNFKNGGGSNDCQDDTTGGTGTNGTDNTWKDNRGKTSFPLKICKK